MKMRCHGRTVVGGGGEQGDEDYWWQGVATWGKQAVVQHGPAAVAAVGAGIAVWGGDV